MAAPVARPLQPSRMALRPLDENPLAAVARRLPQPPPDGIGHDDFDLLSGMRGRRAERAHRRRGADPGDRARRADPAFHPPHRNIWPGIAARSVFPAAAASRAIFRRWKPRCAKPWKRPASRPAFVSIAGFLPRYRTGTGFDIPPVVGVLAPGFALAPDPREVAEIFEVPLAFFLDPANRQRRQPRHGAAAHARFHVFEPRWPLYLGHHRGAAGRFRGQADGARMLYEAP